MAGAYRRRDKNGSLPEKYTIWWYDENGRRRYGTGTTDKRSSRQVADKNENEARLVREGLLDRPELDQREASRRSLKDHIEDYRRTLIAKGNRPKHCAHVAGVVTRLLADAAVESIADLSPNRIQEAIGRLRVSHVQEGYTKVVGSARTANHALAAIKAFARWLFLGHRIREVPRGLLALKPYNEKADRQYVRRALSPEEVERLFAATCQSPPWKRYSPGWPNAELTGEDRVMLYTIAMATGFRANEIRSLTPESFQLTGDKPTITVSAAYSKRGRNDQQPVRRDDAVAIKTWLDKRTTTPGQPVVPVPEKTALMLRKDLERAKIPYRDGAGRVMDFHGLRHTYITNFARRGVHPKVIQTLARHSTVSLTLDRYTHLEDTDVRDALENGGAAPANGTTGGTPKQKPKPRTKIQRRLPKRRPKSV